MSITIVWSYTEIDPARLVTELFTVLLDDVLSVLSNVVVS
jgi:hypothetical protein